MFSPRFPVRANFILYPLAISVLLFAVKTYSRDWGKLTFHFKHYLTVKNMNILKYFNNYKVYVFLLNRSKKLFCIRIKRRRETKPQQKIFFCFFALELSCKCCKNANGGNVRRISPLRNGNFYVKVKMVEHIIELSSKLDPVFTKMKINSYWETKNLPHWFWWYRDLFR